MTESKLTVQAVLVNNINNIPTIDKYLFSDMLTIFSPPKKQTNKKSFQLLLDLHSSAPDFIQLKNSNLHFHSEKCLFSISNGYIGHMGKEREEDTDEPMYNRLLIFDRVIWLFNVASVKHQHRGSRFKVLIQKMFSFVPIIVNIRVAQFCPHNSEHQVRKLVPFLMPLVWSVERETNF